MGVSSMKDPLGTSVEWEVIFESHRVDGEFRSEGCAPAWRAGQGQEAWAAVRWSVCVQPLHRNFCQAHLLLWPALLIVMLESIHVTCI